jgi:hypothetical protein
MFANEHNCMYTYEERQVHVTLTFIIFNAFLVYIVPMVIHHSYIVNDCVLIYFATLYNKQCWSVGPWPLRDLRPV